MSDYEQSDKHMAQIQLTSILRADQNFSKERVDLREPVPLKVSKDHVESEGDPMKIINSRKGYNAVDE